LAARFVFVVIVEAVVDFLFVHAWRACRRRRLLGDDRQGRRLLAGGGRRERGAARRTFHEPAEQLVGHAQLPGTLGTGSCGCHAPHSEKRRRLSRETESLTRTRTALPVWRVLPVTRCRRESPADNSNPASATCPRCCRPLPGAEAC